MSSLHNLKLSHETTCLLSVVALFSTEDLSQEQLRIPYDNVRRQQYNFSLLVRFHLIYFNETSELNAIKLFTTVFYEISK